MKLTKVIYLASAYTCKSKDKKLKYQTELKRLCEITALQGVLQDKYKYAFIGPILMSAVTEQYMKKKSTSFKDWECIDYTFISRSDEMWVYVDSDGAWLESEGVQKEIKYCKKHNIPVKYINKAKFKFEDTKDKV